MEENKNKQVVSVQHSAVLCTEYFLKAMAVYKLKVVFLKRTYC